MTISENQALLIKANARVESIERRISFRPLGQRSKWVSELTRAKKERNLIASDIERESNKEHFKETDAFIKDYEEQEKLLKEKEHAIALLKKYKENPISIPIKEIKEKPDFSVIGDEIIDRNLKELINAQREFNSAKQRASKHSPVGTGGRASASQKARNRLNEATFDISHEPILTDFRELFAEKKYLDMVLKESEVRTDEIQAIISKVEADITLFEKFGLIEQKK